MDDSWITELIFKPGEPRIRLLQWLFSTIDSSLNDVLDPSHSVESRMDSRIQRLLFVASTLGLCRYDDVDIIRGATSPSKQASFIDQLLDLAIYAEDSHHTTSPGIITTSEDVNIEKQLIQDCKFIDTLVEQENINCLFNSQLTLLPPDLQRKVEVGWIEKGCSKDKPPKPDIQTVIESCTKLSKELERQNEILEELKKNFKYQKEGEPHMDKISRTMQLVLSELSQLVVGFSYSYESEMSHWCNKTPPSLTQLGPVFKRVHNLLQQFVNLLNSYRTIRTSYTNLSRDTGDKIHDIISTKKTELDLVSAGQEALEKFQNMISVLDESIQRTDMDATSSTLHSISLRM